MVLAQLLQAVEKADLPSAAPLSETLAADLSAGLRASEAAVALFDPHDRLVFASDAFAAVYGAPDGDPTFDAIMRRCFEAGTGPVLATSDIDAWLRAANAKRRSQPRRHFEVDLVDGRWLLATETICGDGWLLLTLADVTTLKASERRLRQARDAAIEAVNTENLHLKAAEEKLQFANTLLTTQMETSPDGVLVVDADSRIISFNQRYAEMWNIPPELLEAKDDAAVLAAVMSTVKDPQGFLDRVRHLYQHPEETGREELETVDGRFMERHTAVLRTNSGQQLGRVWFFRDITDRKRAEAERLRSARIDALTGLANRAVFMETLREAIAGVGRGAASFGVLYLDLDHFKDVNDTLGHPVGDELLKAVATRLRANARQTDLVARFGGDEFAVLMTNVGEPADAAALADAIIKAIGAPFDIQGNDIRSGASVGISLFGADKPDAETILSRADVALYWAKSERADGYRFHTDAMDTEIRTRVTLGAELREGIVSGQLFLEYQPQVDIATGRVTGVEALVRWRHPTRGVLAPDLFIPIAEKSGLIAPLGHWVLCAACRQMRAWLDANIAPDIMAVNVSAIQFKRPFELESEIADILVETGLAPQRLELELTETTLMAASREHNDLLLRLRASGVRLAIDDFGVGYSSLDYLRRFPANRIKIAQVFVSQIASEPSSAAIVKATIGLARELGIDVIAEGVETPEQLALLQAWGCPEGQGYHFARPLRAEDVTLLLEHGASGRARAGAGRSAA